MTQMTQLNGKLPPSMQNDSAMTVAFTKPTNLYLVTIVPNPLT